MEPPQDLPDEISPCGTSLHWLYHLSPCGGLAISVLTLADEVLELLHDLGELLEAAHLEEACLVVWAHDLFQFPSECLVAHTHRDEVDAELVPGPGSLLYRLEGVGGGERKIERGP